MFAKLQTLSTRRRLSIIAVVLILVGILSWLVLRPSWPKVGWVKVAYSEKSMYPVGFCAYLKYHKLVPQEPSFNSTIDGRDAKPGMVLINQNNGIYCFGTSGEYNAGQKIRITLTSKGDEIINQSFTLPASQNPRIFRVGIIPSQSIRGKGGTLRVSPARIDVQGKYLQSLNLQIGFDGKWFPLGISQLKMATPYIEGSSPIDSISTFIPNLQFPSNSRVMVSMRYRDDGRWKPIYKKEFVKIR